MLIRQETEQPSDVPALRVPTGLGKLPHLRPVHSTQVGEKQQPLVVGGLEQVRHLVIGSQGGATDPPTAAFLHPVLVSAGAFGVAAVGDSDHDVLVGDEVLLGEIAVGRDDAGAPLVAVLVGDLLQFGTDDGTLPGLGGENVLEVGDEPFDLGQPVDDPLDLHRRESPQLLVENETSLEFVDVEELLEALRGLLGGAGGPNQRDDLVQHVEGLDQAAIQVGAFLGIGELEGGATTDDLNLVLDPLRDELIEPQGAGHVVDERQHVAAEGVLQRGVLVQVVHHDPRLGVAFQHDHQAQAGTSGGVVADVRDAGEAPRVHQFRDLGRQVVGVAHVGQLRDRDALAPGGVLLQLHDGPHDHRSTSRAVGVLDAATPDDQTAAGEIGTLDTGHRGLEEFLPGGLGVG